MWWRRRRRRWGKNCNICAKDQIFFFWPWHVSWFPHTEARPASRYYLEWVTHTHTHRQWQTRERTDTQTRSLNFWSKFRRNGSKLCVIFLGAKFTFQKGLVNCPFFRTKGGGSRGSDGPTERGVQLFLLRSHSHKSFPFFFFLLALPSLNLTFSRQHHFQHFETLFATISARFFPPFFKPLAPKTCSSPRNRPRPRDRPFFGGTLHTLWGWKIQFQQQQQQQRFSRSLFRINTLTNTNSLSLNSR